MRALLLLLALAPAVPPLAQAGPRAFALEPAAAPALDDEEAAPAAGLAAPVETPVLQRVVVVGASASDGFMLSVKLAEAFAGMIAAPHDELLSLADGMFFVRPMSIARQQVGRALAHEPSLVLGVDFLFWFTYGNLPEAQRPDLLEAGLALLDRFECPIVVSTVPDMSGAIGKMLSASQVPSAESLAQLNQRIAAWADERPRVVRIDLPRLVGQLGGGVPFELGGRTWPPSRSVRLLQWDELHPTNAGLAALVCVVGQALVESEVVPAAALRLDPGPVYEALEVATRAALEARRAERAARRDARERERAEAGAGGG